MRARTHVYAPAGNSQWHISKKCALQICHWQCVGQLRAFNVPNSLTAGASRRSSLNTPSFSSSSSSSPSLSVCPSLTHSALCVRVYVRARWLCVSRGAQIFSARCKGKTSTRCAWKLFTGCSWVQRTAGCKCGSQILKSTLHSEFCMVNVLRH